MSTLTATIVKILAVLLAAAAGLAIGIALIFFLEMRELQADEAVLCSGSQTPQQLPNVLIHSE